MNDRRGERMRNRESVFMRDEEDESDLRLGTFAVCYKERENRLESD